MAAVGRRFLRILAALILCIGIFTPYTAIQAEDDFSDTTYWTNLCTGADGGGALSAAQKQSCTAFMRYIASQSDSLKDEMDKLDAQKEDIARDLAKYGQEIQNYQSQVAALNTEIATYNGQIAVKEEEIARLETEIADNEAEIEATEDKIKERMVLAQETMRLNPYLDILMGAKSFNDFIRITNGINDITAYDEKTMQDLQVLINKLKEEFTHAFDI